MCTDSAVADVAAGAPAREIEVTPAMIEAGADKLLYFDDGCDPFRVVREILAAISEEPFPVMVRHRRKSTVLGAEKFCHLHVATLEELFPNR